ncbi:AcrR family transcriptional regulator [Chromobacterium alkanivorans]|uniref:TetR/AcrR family transcriptional regulator n=1 Tax=Chromobacterium alkanivorans TaxID=1071719 RepID=UPI0019689B64|nr:TetR/AcrR family transcriptional regulator [Chromobacterium alkanivorans]MBN3004549.1 TetR/AcrR family transcriptional regulator [Chromobacterium alkanivorans]MCS3805023.1 AcrR family transcriptional regulator [Chromobacterium alkanivorans]MCS3819414.1 AcrR family transcriptional regulator [Chromobacterium alkanivorans]MCS3873926.1 AcrR family transcriptional regulator [Chromobacterium alkanivorans]
MSKSGNRSQTFQNIVDASLQLFNQEGERVITTNHIAERMNISTGKLYYHFRNKEEIISELYQRYVKGMAEQLSAALRHSNSIEAMVGAMEKTLRHIWSFRFLPKSMPSLYYLHPELAENHQQLSRGQLAGRLAQLFARLREQGVLLGDDKQLAHLVQHFQMVQTGWVTTLKHSATPAELERMVKDGCRSLLYLLTPYVDPRYRPPFDRVCARYA